MLFLRIHGQGIRAATMRMEESAVPLLKVFREVVGSQLDDIVRRVRVGVRVVREVTIVGHVAGIGNVRGADELNGHRWDGGREVKNGSRCADV